MAVGIGLAGEQREDQFGEAIGFFQMRVARKDEGVDAELAVLLDAGSNLFRAADQCGAGAAAYQAGALAFPGA